jgi:hypothetical protein
METLFNYDGSPTPIAVELGLSTVPEAVIATCERKGIPLETLRFDSLSNYYYPADGWKGMFLGIELDGHSHS